MKLEQVAALLRASRGLQHKCDVGDVLTALNGQVAWPDDAEPRSGVPHAGRGGSGPPSEGHAAAGRAGAGGSIRIGDDCAALADGDGHLLFAIEGLVEEFVNRMPWFAGYCSVMVNVSDIYAMGGRPLAIVNALWSRGMQPADQVLAGMAQAARRYAVPIVGGHTNNRSERGQLAVAILGRARRLLSSFDARPGDRLLVAVDLRGRYEEPYPYWNASTQAPAERLRGDLELLPLMAESGLCKAAKDISMAGVLGTLLMLLECSRVGANIDLDSLPRPAGTDSDDAWLRWLTAFPSYGFVLSVATRQVPAVLELFARRGLSAAAVGEVILAPQVTLAQGTERALLWDFSSERLLAPRLPEPAVRQRSHA
jgi:AIR synthase-related protein